MTEHRETGNLLPCNFQPSPHTVIIGRGREPKQNLGNKRLTVLATSFLQKYQHGDKRRKSQIVSDIIYMIREACKGVGNNTLGGAFVKHAKDGRWYDLDSSVAREKIGYVFRDLLADQYKSSAKSKVARRQRPHALTVRRESAPSKILSQSTTASPVLSNIGGNPSIRRSSAPPLTLSLHTQSKSLRDGPPYGNFESNCTYPDALLDILQAPMASLDSDELLLKEHKVSPTDEQRHDIVPLDPSFVDKNEPLSFFDQEVISRLPTLLA